MDDVGIEYQTVLGYPPVEFVHLAADLGDRLDAFDINPLICSPCGAVAVDALALPRHSPPPPHP